MSNKPAPHEIPPCPATWQGLDCIHPDGANHRGICTWPTRGKRIHPEQAARRKLRRAREAFQAAQAAAVKP